VKVFAISVFFLLYVESIFPQPKPNLADIIDDVRPSVVQVAVHVLLGGQIESVMNARESFPPCLQRSMNCIVGTGFFVNSDGYVVTAFHVVDGFRGPDGTDHPGAKQLVDLLETGGIHSEVVIGISQPNFDNGSSVIAASTEYYSASIVATDPSHDLAIIKASFGSSDHMPAWISGPGIADVKMMTRKAVTISKSRPRDAEDIFACGYAFGEPGLITTSGTIASAWNALPLLRAAAAGFPSSVEVYNVDLRINPGNSGGPVFRMSDQSLVGVAVQSLGSLGIAVPAKFVADFLTSQGIPWTMANSDAKPKANPKKKH
jgi:S1-C subfamily serine protease